MTRDVLEERPKKTNDLIGKNIRFLLKKAGVSIHQLSKNTGISFPTIKRIIDDEDGNPTLNSLESIARYFVVSVASLISEPLEDNMQSPTLLNSSSWTLVPLIAHEDILNWPTNKATILKKEMIKSVSTDSDIGSDAYAIMAIGSSMEPAIPEKSILIVDPAGTQNNQSFVIILRQNANLPQVKQLLIDGPDKYFRSLNVGNNEPVLLNSDLYKIVGVVKEIILKF